MPAPHRHVLVTRYVTPLREGGSLPAIAEADDGFLYALKFRGAGQGIKALIADLLGGEIARVLGFKVPEIVFADLDESFGRTEPDEEIQDLLKASTGLNLALHYLSGAITYDPAVTPLSPTLASGIVWLDLLITNVDRTAKNPNLLTWRGDTWLIDHGAAFYHHHSGPEGWVEKAVRPFPLIKDHVLLPQAAALGEVDATLRPMLTSDVLANLVATIPDVWLDSLQEFSTPAEHRSAYADFLAIRLAHFSSILNAAQDARQALL